MRDRRLVQMLSFLNSKVVGTAFQYATESCHYVKTTNGASLAIGGTSNLVLYLSRWLQDVFFVPHTNRDDLRLVFLTKSMPKALQITW